MLDSYKKLFDLSNKVVLITGAAGILGSHFSYAFAEFGAKLVLLDVNQESLLDLAKIIKEKYSVECLAEVCDVTNEDAIRSVRSKALQRFKKIDVLVNNAAGKSEDLDAFFANFENYDLDQWKKIIDVNLNGMFLMAKTIGAQMLKQGFGSIIQTASIYGSMAPDQRIYKGSFYLNREINSPAVYSVAKAGVVGLTKHLACLWAEQGIRVNSISPGGVQSGQNEIFQRKYAARVPMGRMALPHEMAGAILFLASEAASYVTGQNLMVDGGLSAW